MHSRTLRLAGLGATAAAAITTGALPATALAAKHKPKAKPKGRHYSGKTARTPYGPVHVTITVKKRKVTAIGITADPHTSLSYQLQSYSLPVLRREALKTQTYKIHTISGATFTSYGFISSLYSAMHHAKLV